MGHAGMTSSGTSSEELVTFKKRPEVFFERTVKVHSLSQYYGGSLTVV